MKEKIEWLYKRVFKLRLLIILMVIVTFFVFGYWSQSVEMDSSAKIDSVLQEHDPYLLQYKDFEKIFGSNNYIIVGLEAEDVFTNENLGFIQELSRKLKGLEGLKDIYSLSTLYDVRSNNQNDFVVEKFITEDSYSSKELSDMKDYFTNHPFLANRIVGKEGKATLLQVQMKDNLDETEQNMLVGQIKDVTTKIINKRNVNIKPYYAGDAVVSTAIVQAQKKDEFLYPLMLTALFFILLLVFRRFLGIVLPLSVVVITMTTILGLKSITNSRMSTIDPLLYALITSIAVGDSIHIVSAWYNKHFDSIKDKKEKMLTIMKELFVPCLLTTITTAVGFGSIAISQIPQIKQFGIFAAIGVIFAFLLTVLGIPVVFITFGRVKKENNVEKKEASSLKIKFKNLQVYMAARIAMINTKYAKSILIIFLVVATLSICEITKIKTGTNMYSFLKDDNPVNESLYFIEDNISGISDIEILVSGDITGLFKEPEVLKKVESLQNYVEGLDGITVSNSYLSLIKLINQAMHNGDSQYYTIPSSRKLISQYLLLYEMSEDTSYLNRWVNDSFDKLRINFKTANSANLKDLEEKINTFFKEKGFENMSIGITGSAVLLNRTDNLFISSQINSLLLAIIVISIIMMYLFKSLKLGMFSLIVNLMPILCGLGMLGFFNIKLDMGTAMIAPIAIGIAVDDTIHFLTQFKRNISESNLATIFRRVYRIILKPIVFTSVVLAVGFGSNAVSSFKPNAYFGIISALTLLIAMFCDLFLLPSLIVVFKGNKIKANKISDNVTIKN